MTKRGDIAQGLHLSNFKNLFSLYIHWCHTASKSVNCTWHQHEDHLELQYASTVMRFDYVWLRDHCRSASCYNSKTHQRSLDTASVDLYIKPKTIRLDETTLFFTWPDGHVTRYDLDWLVKNSYEGQMAFSAPPAFLTHRQKVLRLYKRALRHLESWCIHRDKYRYFACLMRARFEEHKNEKDMMRATQLLREAEEEFWQNQHPQPYIFPDSPGGTSYERYECYKVPEWCLEYWHPSEKAEYPDYFSKREQWKKLRMESWDREVKQLQEETPPDGIMTEALPPARKEGDLPPLWWHIVTRPRERPT